MHTSSPINSTCVPAVVDVPSPPKTTTRSLSSPKHELRAWNFISKNYRYFPVVSTLIHLSEAVACAVMSIFFSLSIAPLAISLVSAKIFIPEKSESLKTMTRGAIRGSIICTIGAIAHLFLSFPLVGSIFDYTYDNASKKYITKQ
jgi:hypothetical protein